ncbi:MAG: GGDEF domain-containing protein [Rhodoferax sp.]|nr:GGDEF domain-containing protein [Rhodoferax sp.]
MLEVATSRARHHLRPRSTPAWLSAQRLESLVAQRTYALEQVIEQLRAKQAELEALANHDSLTGLATRRRLKDRFQCAVARAKRDSASFAVLVIDLDGFKRINDTHGHAAGDAVLVEVARRLTVALRTTDTAARLGGDEFVLIVECPNGPFATDPVCKKVKAAVSESITLDNGVVVSVGASVGQAVYPHDGIELEQTLRAADQSMYANKAAAHAAHTPAARTDLRTHLQGPSRSALHWNGGVSCA